MSAEKVIDSLKTLGSISILALICIFMGGCRPQLSDHKDGGITEPFYWETEESTREDIDLKGELWFVEMASLLSAEEVLREQSLGLKIQNLKVEQARRSIGISRARSLPSLSAGLQVADGKNEGQSSTHSWGTSLSSSWELDLWGVIASVRREAELGVELGETQLEALHLSLIYQILGAQIRLAGVKERLALTHTQIDEQKEMEAQALELFRNGQGSDMGVLLQKEARLGLEAGLPLLEENRQAAILDLGQLLRMSEGELEPWMTLKLPVELSEVPPSNGSEWVGRRFDSRMAWLKVLQSDESWLQARARRLPSLTLQAELGYSGQHPVDLFDRWFRQLSGSLLAPIFDGNRRKLEAALAGDVTQQRLLEFREGVEAAFGELERLRLSWNAQRASWLGKGRQRDVAAKALSSLKERYNIGQASFLEVLQQRAKWRSLQQQALSHRIESLILQAAWAGAQAFPITGRPTYSLSTENEF